VSEEPQRDETHIEQHGDGDVNVTQQPPQEEQQPQPGPEEGQTESGGDPDQGAE